MLRRRRLLRRRHAHTLQNQPNDTKTSTHNIPKTFESVSHAPNIKHASREALLKHLQNSKRNPGTSARVWRSSHLAADDRSPKAQAARCPRWSSSGVPGVRSAGAPHAGAFRAGAPRAICRGVVGPASLHHYLRTSSTSLGKCGNSMSVKNIEEHLAPVPRRKRGMGDSAWGMDGCCHWLQQRR